jgi:hypothetical protein
MIRVLLTLTLFLLTGTARAEELYNVTGLEGGVTLSPAGEVSTVTLRLLTTGFPPEPVEGRTMTLTLPVYPLPPGLVTCEDGLQVHEAEELGNGYYRFSFELAGGIDRQLAGDDPSMTTHLEWGDSEEEQTGLSLPLAATDLTGDLVVDLSDIGLFTPYIGSNGYDNGIADLNHDFDIDLTDIATFAANIGATCGAKGAGMTVDALKALMDQDSSPEAKTWGQVKSRYR